MKTPQDRTTQPCPQREMEALRIRLAESKRMLEAFPEPLPAPCLLRKVPSGSAGDVEALPLSGVVTIVGREGDPPFCFPDDRLSAQHFRVLVAENGTCYVQDLQSTNHLYINGVRVIGHRRLVHGDQIHAGSQDFVFHDGKKVEHESSDF